MPNLPPLKMMRTSVAQARARGMRYIQIQFKFSLDYSNLSGFSVAFTNDLSINHSIVDCGVITIPRFLPLIGKIILWMDASHRHWGAVLYEEDKKGKRQICGYKSGTFKDSQLHHHSTFKELLAIKQGILKFEFHLIGNHFLVETDFAASKGMLKFKPNKAVLVSGLPIL
ncbi:hypothetical protein TIFTF001_035713 [Ficus carica]|uniref:Reverse transcriptase RNase H-like domain-containing protein n=1 Tax=Ficus carica TaxID=3494 RepID=A0AA88E2W0_FICCA|nr:hypothetical protein TIFTF001_035712 [Ficus carica]GMN66650.1 hypothetical protein TIFTF001_035713 [Ficus carica]